MEGDLLPISILQELLHPVQGFHFAQLPIVWQKSSTVNIYFDLWGSGKRTPLLRLAIKRNSS
jgi:hypothetical protein